MFAPSGPIGRGYSAHDLFISAGGRWYFAIGRKTDQLGRHLPGTDGKGSKLMMYLRLEFFKCRRRKIVPVCAALLGAQLIWFVIYLLRQDAQALSQGWMLLLYNLALDDAIMLP